MSNVESQNWQAICSIDELTPFIGVRALLGEDQVAIFKVQDELYAINAIDPFTKTAILSRGIVGDLDGEVVVASPLYKQHFSLKTGVCLEDDSVSVSTYSIRENNGVVELSDS